MAAIGALVIGGGALVVIIPTRSTVSPVVVVAPPAFPAFQAAAARPAEPSAADRARAKAQYEADRTMLRKIRPRPTTEAEVTKAIGRKPDSVITAGPATHIHWYYETKEIGRDVLAISTNADGKIVLADF